MCDLLTTAPCYFNSRPRVGGVQDALVKGGYLQGISILAPAWGASNIFAQMIQEGDLYFNSRPRVGGVLLVPAFLRHLHISILAPAWGASLKVSGTKAGHRVQFSPPRGGRPVQ